MLDFEQLADSDELFDGQYKLLCPLSTDGGTADIWLAVDTNTIDDDEKPEATADEEQGLKVAIKVYRPQNALDIEGIQKFRKEFKVVYNCQHSNLLHPSYFSVYKETPYLVLPYCKNGSTELLTGQLTSEDAIWKFVHDVASGLHYLHTNEPQIIHQDIKPANILIDDKHNYTITDFGISISATNRTISAEENSGTFAYMAPERFAEGAEPMPQSDIWALGATLYELMTGNVPFGEGGGNTMPMGKTELYFPDGIPNSIRRIVYACLDASPMKRPTAAELIEASNKREHPINRPRKMVLYTALASLGALVLVGSAALFLHSNRLPKTSDVQEREADVHTVLTDSTKSSSADIRPQDNNQREEDVKPLEEYVKQPVDDIGSVRAETGEKPVKPVVEKEVVEPGTSTSEPRQVRQKQLNLGYAVWEGNSKNGRPDGYGTMTFTEDHLIDSRDAQRNVARSGDRVEGNYANGHLEYGTLIKSDGERIQIFIGQ